MILKYHGIASWCLSVNKKERKRYQVNQQVRKIIVSMLFVSLFFFFIFIFFLEEYYSVIASPISTDFMSVLPGLEIEHTIFCQICYYLLGNPWLPWITLFTFRLWVSRYRLRERCSFHKKRNCKNLRNRIDKVLPEKGNTYSIPTGTDIFFNYTFDILGR